MQCSSNSKILFDNHSSLYLCACDAAIGLLAAIVLLLHLRLHAGAVPALSAAISFQSVSKFKYDDGLS